MSSNILSSAAGLKAGQHAIAPAGRGHVSIPVRLRLSARELATELDRVVEVLGTGLGRALAQSRTVLDEEHPGAAAVLSAPVFSWSGPDVAHVPAALRQAVEQRIAEVIAREARHVIQPASAGTAASDASMAASYPSTAASRPGTAASRVFAIDAALSPVVQEAQVSATIPMKGVDVNDEAGLEREPGEMGASARQGESGRGVGACAQFYAMDLGGAPEHEELQEAQGVSIQREPLAPVGTNAFFDPGSLSAGAPLPEPTRVQMESAFGQDFSDVRIHTDGEAASAAAAVNAKAFTSGTDIVFGAGRFAPGTREGDHLLAHELTHVVQQRRRGASIAGTGLESSLPGKLAEIEADRVADAVVSGGAARVDTGMISAASGAIARKEERDWWDLTGWARDAAIGRVRQTLHEYWPEGAGMIISGRLGATFVVPIALDLGGKEELFRMEATTFKITRAGQMRVGLDTSVGASESVNIGPVRAEVRASASAGTGLKMTVSEEYEFPTDTDAGLLGFLQRVVPLEVTSMGQIASVFLQTISGVDPALYRRKFTVELAGYGEASAGAVAGLRFGGQGADVNTTNQQAQQAATQQQPWWARLLPNALATAGIRLEAGLGLEVEVKPEDDPKSLITGRIYMLAGATASAGASINLSGGDGAQGRLLSIIRQRFQVVDVDLQAQLGLTFSMNRQGKITWTGYQAKLRSHPTDDMGVVDSTGTDVTAFYNSAQEKQGVQGNLVGAVAEWIDRLIPDTLEIEKRLGLGTGFGRRWIALNGPLMRNELRLAGDYQKTGFSVDGVLKLTFKLDRQKLQRVAIWMKQLVTGSRDAKAQALKAWQDFIHWFQTGQAPSWARNPSQIADFLKDAGLDDARVRFTASFGVGAGASVGAGLKARLDGGITVAGFQEIDLRAQAAALIQDCIAHLSDFLSTTGGATQALVPADD